MTALVVLCVFAVCLAVFCLLMLLGKCHGMASEEDAGCLLILAAVILIVLCQQIIKRADALDRGKPAAQTEGKP